MADDKQGRNDQADNEEDRQQQRMQAEARTRADEKEPVPDEPDDQLGDLGDAIDSHDYPAKTGELVEAYGDYDVETQDGVAPFDAVLDESDDRTYDSSDDLRARILGLIHR
ncbi:uncharacterized protein HHUB_3605 [Halobacterium hubeiense]|uniref:Uncharacterized protein n=1 Tax=Halobacterium hubeiense TaxID=1407499 RepID=A0A0U5AIR0_9EURY|nr:hypothetical protein [Halobacterium hubeiense]CQH61974.1 uncharacterized protein HHUB_3605 [Halobacterium hubeiense]